MNYIRHLNAFFALVKHDNRLTASHVSLYLALFQYWNFNRFQNPFPIYRTDIMMMSRIGSKNTYHKCVRELHHCKYIYYHPAPYKYQPVKISIARLDKSTSENRDQLDLFSSTTSPEAGIKNDTAHVPDLTATSPNNDTAQVPESGHPLKQSNYKQERETPSHDEKKNGLKDKTNASAHVPNSIPVTQTEVEAFFKQNQYPISEARKFFNHYKAIGWKIQGVTPIEDWKALVEKWMTNVEKWDPKKEKTKTTDPDRDIQYLSESFFEGKKIFHLITPVHFEYLKLELSEALMKQAWQERIHQVAGTNQHSLNQLWKAYLTGDIDHELVVKDRSKLEELAKRIAVLNHFHKLKNQSQ